MQIKTKFNNLLTKNSENNIYDCININHGLIHHIHKICNKKCEKDIKGFNPPNLAGMNDINSFSLNRTDDINDIYISLKLKLKIINKSEGEVNGKPYFIYFDINPKGVMSKNQKKIYYQYKYTNDNKNEYFSKFPNKDKLKYFSALSHKLTGKVVQHKGSTYVISNLLQSAIYGGVYLCTTGEYPEKSSIQYKKAIKILSKHIIEMTRDQVQEDPLSEYYYRDTMSRHSNVLSCDYIFDDTDYIYMVMSFAAHGDLFEVMKVRNKAFTEEEGRYLFYQILLAIKFLHSKKLALRDISLENILLFENEKNGLIYPVLNDPGQAIYFKLNQNNQVITEKYQQIFGKIFRPPEIYEKCNYDPTKIDIFCVGYILYFCLTKHELFKCALNKDLYWELLKHKKYKELLKDKKGLHLSNEVLDLIFHCLEPDFNKRFNINQALNHPWFKGKMSPLYNLNLYLNNKEYSTHNDTNLPKLFLEIQNFTKKNNIKIDENTNMQFDIFEHAFVLSNRSVESQKIGNSGNIALKETLRYSHRNCKSKNENNSIVENAFIYENRDVKDKDSVGGIYVEDKERKRERGVDNERNAVGANGSCNITIDEGDFVNTDHAGNDNNGEYKNDHINNTTINNIASTITAKEPDYRDLLAKINPFGKTTNIKILNSYKNNISKLIELKKKHTIPSKGIPFREANISDDQISARNFHKKANSIENNKSTLVKPTKNNDSGILKLDLENQLKKKSELRKTRDDVENTILCIKQLIKENGSNRNSFSNAKSNVDKISRNKDQYESFKGVKEALSEFSKNEKRIEELPKHGKTYNTDNNDMQINDVQNRKNNSNVNILSNIENETIKIGSSEFHKKNILDINNNVFNFQINQDTKAHSLSLNCQQNAKNSIKDKPIVSDDHESLKALHDNMLDMDDIKEMDATNNKKKNDNISNGIICEKAWDNQTDTNNDQADDQTDHITCSPYKNNIKPHNVVLCRQKENDLNEKENHNSIILHNLNVVNDTIFHGETSDKNNKEDSCFLKENSNDHTSSYTSKENQCINSLQVSEKISGYRESIMSQDDKLKDLKELNGLKKLGNNSFYKTLKDKKNFVKLKHTLSLDSDKNSYLKIKKKTDSKRNLKNKILCVANDHLINASEEEFTSLSKNISVIGPKQKTQINLQTKLESKIQLKSEGYSQCKMNYETNVEKHKSKEDLECELAIELENVIKNEERELGNLALSGEDDLGYGSGTNSNRDSNYLMNEFEDEMRDELEEEVRDEVEEEVRDELEEEVRNELEEVRDEVEEEMETTSDYLKNTIEGLQNKSNNSFEQICSHGIYTNKKKKNISRRKSNEITIMEFSKNKSKNKSYKIKSNASYKLQIKTKSISKAKKGIHAIYSEKRGKATESKKKRFSNKKCAHKYDHKRIHDEKLENHSNINKSSNNFEKNKIFKISINDLEPKNENSCNTDRYSELSNTINVLKSMRNTIHSKLKINHTNKKNSFNYYTHIPESPLTQTNKKTYNITNKLDSNMKKEKTVYNKKMEKLPLLYNFRNTIDILYNLKKKMADKINDYNASNNFNTLLLKESMNKKTPLKETILSDVVKSKICDINLSNSGNTKNAYVKVKKNESLNHKLSSEKKKNILEKNTNVEVNRYILKHANIEQINKKNTNKNVNQKNVKREKGVTELCANKDSKLLPLIPVDKVKKAMIEKVRYEKRDSSIDQGEKIHKEDLNNVIDSVKSKSSIIINLDDKKSNANKVRHNISNVAHIRADKNNDINNSNCGIKNVNKNTYKMFNSNRFTNLYRMNDNVNDEKHVKRNHLNNSNKLNLYTTQNKYCKSNKLNYNNTKSFIKSIKSRKTITYPMITPDSSKTKQNMLLHRNTHAHYIPVKKTKSLKKVADVESKSGKETKNINNNSLLETFMTKANKNVNNKNKDCKLGSSPHNYVDKNNKKTNTKTVKKENILDKIPLKKTNTLINTSNLHKRENYRTTQMLNEIFLKKSEKSKKEEWRKLKNIVPKNDTKNKQIKEKQNISLRATVNLVHNKSGNLKNTSESIDNYHSDIQNTQKCISYIKKSINNKLNRQIKKTMTDGNKTKEHFSSTKKTSNSTEEKKEQKDVCSIFENEEKINHKESEVSNREGANDREGDEESNNKNNSYRNSVSNYNYKLCTAPKKIIDDHTYCNSEYLKVKQEEYIQPYSQSKVQINNTLNKCAYVKENNTINVRATYNGSSMEQNKNNKSIHVNKNEMCYSYVNTKNINDIPCGSNLKEVKNSIYKLENEIYLDKLKTLNGSISDNIDTFLNNKEIESSHINDNTYNNTSNKAFLNHTNKKNLSNKDEKGNLFMKKDSFIVYDKLSYNGAENITTKYPNSTKPQHINTMAKESDNFASLNINKIKNDHSQMYNKTNFSENITEKANIDKNNNSSSSYMICNKNSELHLKQEINLNVRKLIPNVNNKLSSKVLLDNEYYNLINKNVDNMESINKKEFTCFNGKFQNGSPEGDKLRNDATANENIQTFNNSKNLPHKNTIVLKHDPRSMYLNNINNVSSKCNTGKTEIRPVLYKNIKSERIPYPFKDTKKNIDVFKDNQMITNVGFEKQQTNRTQHILYSEGNKKYSNYMNNTSHINPNISHLNPNISHLNLNFSHLNPNFSHMNLNKPSYMNNAVNFKHNNFYIENRVKKDTNLNANAPSNVDLNKKTNIHQGIKGYISGNKCINGHTKYNYNEISNKDKNHNRTNNTNINYSLNGTNPFYVNNKNEILVPKNVRLVNTLDIKRLANQNNDAYYSIPNKNVINQIGINTNSNHIIVNKPNVLKIENDQTVISFFPNIKNATIKQGFKR